LFKINRAFKTEAGSRNMKKLMYIVVLVVLVGISSCSSNKYKSFSDVKKNETTNYYPLYGDVSTSDYAGDLVEEYFPLRTGNKLTYEISVPDGDDEERIISSYADSNNVVTITIGNVTELSEHHDYFKNTVNGYFVVNSKQKASNYIKHDSCISMMYIYGDRFVAYVLIFDYNIHGNDYFGCSYLGEKEITVPAGKFNTKVFAVRNWEKSNNQLFYFAKGVGWVRFEVLNDDMEVHIRHDLIEYNLVDD